MKNITFLSLFISSLFLFSCSSTVNEEIEDELRISEVANGYQVDYSGEYDLVISDNQLYKRITNESGDGFKEEQIIDYDLVCAFYCVTADYRIALPQEDFKNIKLIKDINYSLKFCVKERIINPKNNTWHYELYTIKNDLLSIQSDSFTITDESQNTLIIEYKNVDFGEMKVSFNSKEYKFSIEYLNKNNKNSFLLSVATIGKRKMEINPNKTVFKENEKIDIAYGAKMDTYNVIMCNGFAFSAKKIDNPSDELIHMSLSFPPFDMVITLF